VQQKDGSQVEKNMHTMTERDSSRSAKNTFQSQGRDINPPRQGWQLSSRIPNDW
jgi:hypothetical protein